MERTGLLHLYYGDGKGKTTAAMGLALRALGSGKKVVVLQFLKGGQSGEIPLLEQLGAKIYRGKAGQKFVFQMNEAEKAATRDLQNRNLAAATTEDADLLVLDEPVTGLDPAAAQDLYRTLAYLNKTEGIAIVMVTHDMENALRYADFILHAGQGQHFFGTVQDYLSSPMGRRFGGESA